MRVKEIVSDMSNQCFIVDIGASEMRQYGVRPDQYEKYEELLESVGIAHLPRLTPVLIWGVTFWGRSRWASEEDIKLEADIYAALFSRLNHIDIASVGVDSPMGRKWLNRQCDVHGMLAHIKNQNEIFLTADTDFTKEPMKSKLLALGAGKICQPK